MGAKFQGSFSDMYCDSINCHVAISPNPTSLQVWHTNHTAAALAQLDYPLTSHSCTLISLEDVDAKFFGFDGMQSAMSVSAC